MGCLHCFAIVCSQLSLVSQCVLSCLVFITLSRSGRGWTSRQLNMCVHRQAGENQTDRDSERGSRMQTRRQDRDRDMDTLSLNRSLGYVFFEREFRDAVPLNRGFETHYFCTGVLAHAIFEQEFRDTLLLNRSSGTHCFLNTRFRAHYF